MHIQCVTVPEQQPAVENDQPQTTVGHGKDCDTIADVLKLRKDLWGHGFRPIAVYGPESQVGSPGKQPQGNNWLDRARQDPPEAAVSNPELIALNTGILCDGLVVIDVDVDDPELAAAVRASVETELGPSLARTRTNSSRSLLLYRAAGWQPASKRIKGSKGMVELLGCGRQFVAYGVHATCAPLVWSPHGPAEVDIDNLLPVSEQQISALRPKLEELLGMTPTGAANSTAAIHVPSVLGQKADPLDVVAALSVIPNEGPKDWEHWNHVGMAAYAASNGAMSGFSAWCAWSEKHPEHNPELCQQRWKNYENSPPSKVGAGTLFHLAAAAQTGWKKWTSGTHQFSEPSLMILSAPQLMAMQLPPRGIVLSSWLPEKGLAMVYGPRGIGKTYLIHGAAYAIASGGAFLKWLAPKPRRVLVIDGEMPAAALQERLKVSLKGKIPDRLHFLPLDLQETDLDLSDPAHHKQLEPHLVDIDVIFVDNISTLTRSGRENEAESWLPVQDWALGQRRAGRSVVFVHHAGKGGQQRGTSRREDVLDTVISLRKPTDYHPEQGARFEIHYEKSRGFYGPEAGPLEAALVKGQWEVRDLTDAKMQSVIELTLTNASVRDIAEELGLSKSQVHRLQTLARELGKLPGGGAKGAAVPMSQPPTVGEWDTY